MSLTLVVLGARLNYQWETPCKRNETVKYKETQEITAISEVKHRHGNSVAYLQCACVDMSIIYFTTRKEKDQFTSCPAAKHQNTANLGLQTCEQNQWTFFMVSHGRRLLIPH